MDKTTFDKALELNKKLYFLNNQEKHLEDNPVFDYDFKKFGLGSLFLGEVRLTELETQIKEEIREAIKIKKEELEKEFEKL